MPQFNYDPVTDKWVSDKAISAPGLAIFDAGQVIQNVTPFTATSAEGLKIVTGMTKTFGLASSGKYFFFFCAHGESTQNNTINTLDLYLNGVAQPAGHIGMIFAAGSREMATVFGAIVTVPAGAQTVNVRATAGAGTLTIHIPHSFNWFNVG